MSNQVIDRIRENHVFSLYPRSTSCAKNILSTLFILCASLTFCLAQNPPTTFRLNPAEFDDEDTVDLAIDYGTSTHHDTNVLSVTFVYECIGFTVDPSSSLSLDFTNSWFDVDPYWTSEVTTSANGDSITLVLERTDDQPVEGYGEIASVGGIIVDLEEMAGKRGEKPRLSLASVAQKSGLISEISIYPNPVQDWLTIQWERNSYESSVEIFDLKGVNIYTINVLIGNQLSLDVSNFPYGIYIVKIKNGRDIQTKKLRISR